MILVGSEEVEGWWAGMLLKGMREWQTSDFARL